VEEYLFVSQAVRELEKQFRIFVRPQELSNFLYRRGIPGALCPVIGGRRLIPIGALPLIAKALGEHCPVQDTQTERPGEL
jgi:hypothetical protein